MLFVLGAMTLFSCSDALAKHLGGYLPPVEIAFIRYAVFTIFACAMAWRSNARVMARAPVLQIARGLLLVCAALSFITCIRTMPMAEAAAIGFVSPVLMTALSVPILAERVGWRRWAAVLAGLLGVLVVARPGGAAFQPAAVLSFIAALTWAMGVVLTRRMAGADTAPTTLLWTAGAGLVVMAVLLPFDAVLPSPGVLALAVLLGTVASAGQYLLILGYRMADASLLAPFSYTQLVWATLFGWLIFGALPDGWTVAGAGIIVASSIVAARAERREARA